MEAVSQRTSAFAELDESVFTLQHLKSVVIAGAGFFGDAYDIFVIGLALPMIYRVYYPPPNGSDPYSRSTFAENNQVVDSILKALTNWGNVFGQLIFGYLGDSVGRKKIYGVELLLMMIATFGSALSGSTVRGIGILGMLGFWRFVLGLGIGGDYPLSATITSEFANSRRRGMMIAAVFAMQGIGILAGGLFAVIFLYAFSGLIQSDIYYLDYVWRLLLGIGVIPCIATIYYRFTMPESPRYKEFVKKQPPSKAAGGYQVLEKKQAIHTVVTSPNTSEVSSHHSSMPTSSDDAILSMDERPPQNPPRENSSFLGFLSVKRNLFRLMATSYCWFALDVAWYGLTINTQLVLKHLGFGENPNSTQYDIFWIRSLGSVLIVTLGTVPGYWVTVFTIDRLGRKFIQIMGFAIISIILILLGAFWTYFSNPANKIAFIVLFSVAQFFFNFGPNQTTFIYPAELFPTAYRSRAHGISACSGKVGAIVGVQAAASLFSSHPVAILICFGLVMMTGGIASLALPETKSMSLEDASGEYKACSRTTTQQQSPHKLSPQAGIGGQNI